MKNVYSRGGVLIGNVPDTWTVNKTLRCLDMPITDGPHETPSAVDEIDGIPFVSAEAVSCGNGSIDFEHIWGFISKEYYKECCKKYIPRIDDIYMIKSGATTGKVAIVDTERIFTIWSPLAVFRANTFIIKPKYLFYFLQSPMYLSQVELGWNYGTQQNIGMRALEQLYISYPSLTEQQQIVHFLDRKCTAIDTAIEKTKKSIEKLEEYKKAVITKAVTKGIDPNAKMKDSGVEWIGEIPEAWDVIKLKYLLKDSMKYGATETGIEYSEELPRYIRITDITPDNKLKDSGKLSLTEQQAEKYLLKEDTILFARSGATVGKTFLYKTEYGRAAFAGYMISAIPNNDKLLATWLYYYTLSFSYADWVNRSFLQATIQNIGADKYSNLLISLPCINKQSEIVKYLDDKCAMFDAAIKKKKKAIEKWEEYKKSLIYYAVTGKIDCRNEVI